MERFLVAWLANYNWGGAFLNLFNPVRASDWVEIVPGRVGCLHLRGEWGSMILITAYLCAIHPHERVRALMRIRDHLRMSGTSLIVLAGDFNFVTDPNDRWSEVTGTASGGNDRETQALHSVCGEF